MEQNKVLQDTKVPRTLDVIKFANARQNEIKELTSLLNIHPQATSVGEDNPTQQLELPNHLRRRSRSHNRHKKLFVLKKRKQSEQEGSVTAPEDAVTEGRKLCRRLRRRNTMKDVNRGLVSYTSEGLRMLESHMWHAKRCKMEKMWGHVVAGSLSGRCVF